ncbi:DUF1648 domain-containing protein [Terribacillus saccharophilus]|uniref:DUF1648 domain-containing protein n=1 Tax=Terribacillus saccharophilus TaxID=361277 RepID=A0ABX4H0N5_9BACI|nr:DUF1648 domain-containing protein [Terribacillus saccharophilus]PAD33749.1 hypothetical protein CHH56_18090 [Terribacillus saccharophilus]PAD95071.1 hypothetical protein CHH50_15215 [Terribacillus saccharophilus]PAE00690.1 hypothetical protein CHH48_05980 [Terribacillus saccharophilus]
MPKQLNIPKTRSEKVWDIIGIGGYIATVVFLIIIWRHLPEQVPLHMGLTGHVDDWAAKESMLLLPALSIPMFTIMHLLGKYPHIHNYPKRLNDENAAAFYQLSRKMLNKVKNICVLIFCFIELEFSMIALGWINDGQGWTLIVILLAVFYPIVEGMMKQRKIK